MSVCVCVCGGAHRGTARDALLLIVGGWSHTFPGAWRRGGSFAARFRRLGLRVFILLCQCEQVAEPAGPGSCHDGIQLRVCVFVFAYLILCASSQLA